MCENGPGSIPVGKSVSCLKSELRTVKKHLPMRKNTVLLNVDLVKYSLPALFEVYNNRCSKENNYFSHCRLTTRFLNEEMVLYEMPIVGFVLFFSLIMSFSFFGFFLLYLNHVPSSSWS